MKNIKYIVLSLAIVVSLVGCGGNLYFGTSTSVGLDVSGTGKVPNKVSFAYDREEIAIVPEDGQGNPHSVFASLDSEWTWIDGFYVKQNFATGKAAEIVAADIEETHTMTDTPRSGTTPTTARPLVFTTGTRVGINLEFGQTSSAPMSLLVGYKRAEMTLMPDVAGQDNVDPVFADISIVTTDKALTGTAEAPLIGGIKIKQKFATGKAAVNAAKSGDMRTKLRSAVYGNPVARKLEIDRNKKDAVASIEKRFAALGEDKKKVYVEMLNSVFNISSGSSELITSSNLNEKLPKLKDEQLCVANDLIKPF